MRSTIVAALHHADARIYWIVQISFWTVLGVLLWSGCQVIIAMLEWVEPEVGLTGGAGKFEVTPWAFAQAVLFAVLLAHCAVVALMTPDSDEAGAALYLFGVPVAVALLLAVVALVVAGWRLLFG